MCITIKYERFRLRKILFPMLLIISVLISACDNQMTEEADIDELQVLQEASDKIVAADAFRLYVLQEGAPYSFTIALADGLIEVRFRLADAQYVAPDTIQATASVIALGGLRVDVDIYADGDDQWFRIPALSTPWQNADFAEGFNPSNIVADGSGFQAVLTTLTNLQLIGTETLDDGQPVYHMSGIADGPSVGDLIVGLLDVENDVPIDIFVNRETGFPVRLVMTQPETVTEEFPDPTTWIIDVYDINEEPILDPPTGS